MSNEVSANSCAGDIFQGFDENERERERENGVMLARLVQSAKMILLKLLFTLNLKNIKLFTVFLALNSNLQLIHSGPKGQLPVNRSNYFCFQALISFYKRLFLFTHNFC